MVTGASTADLAVILIDARKGVLTQTRRHSYLVSLLGFGASCWPSTRWISSTTRRTSSSASSATTASSRDASASTTSRAFPISAVHGDNVVQPRDAMPWYTGPTLLEHLETRAGRRRSRGEAVPDAGAVGEPAESRLSRASPASIVERHRAAGRRRSRRCPRAVRAASRGSSSAIATSPSRRPASR